MPGQDNDEQGGRWQGPTAIPRQHDGDDDGNNGRDGTTNDNVDTAPPSTPRATARGVDGGERVQDPSRQGQRGRHKKAQETSSTSLGPYISFFFFLFHFFITSKHFMYLLLANILYTYYYGKRRHRGITTTTAASACSQGGRMRMTGQGGRREVVHFFVLFLISIYLSSVFFRI